MDFSIELGLQAEPNITFSIFQVLLKLNNLSFKDFDITYKFEACSGFGKEINLQTRSGISPK